MRIYNYLDTFFTFWVTRQPERIGARGPAHRPDEYSN